MKKEELEILREAARAQKEAEKIIKTAERIEKQARRKLEKELEKAEKTPKPQKSEAELVRQYANIIMAKQRTRGMIADKFQDMKGQKPNKDLWQDSDFFFSVVFQSKDQKYQFLERLEEMFPLNANDRGDTIQIINGIRLAESMGIELRKEIANDYPTGNIELRDLILD